MTMTMITETENEYTNFDTYIYIVDLPCGIDEAVTPCIGGYTIYINAKLTMEEQCKALKHALYHIQNDDFSKDNVQQIEEEAHRKVV